jgi:hypothetical protein
MISWLHEGDEGDIFVHDLYKEFARWYVTEHAMQGLRNAWGVFQTAGTSRRCDPPTSKRWSELVRLRIFDTTRTDSKLIAGKGMQELHKLVLLQLHDCSHLTVLNLQGLYCLRHLELVNLPKLETITLTDHSEEDAGTYDSLQILYLKYLSSLKRMPDFRQCTSLQSVVIEDCPELTSFEAIECPGMKYLKLEGIYLHQLGGLQSTFKSLHSLLSLRIDAVRRTFPDPFNSFVEYPEVFHERWECFDVPWDSETQDLDFEEPELPAHYLTPLGKLHVEVLRQVRLDLKWLIRCKLIKKKAKLRHTKYMHGLD